MAVVANIATTTNTVVGTELTILSATTTGVFTWHVDRVNQVSGDVLELRITQIALTGGTNRGAYVMKYYGAPLTDETMAISVPIGNDLTDATSLSFTMKQTFGTTRAFPNKVVKYS